ncbi:MAG: hypothetical protein HY245_09785 [Rhizobiales bacterium]|nr:hypothetical protein [Hyphomicrobiales bacterium]MBI3673692.1 hypothetical protein [Hyphomicrobiales bacterium]
MTRKAMVMMAIVLAVATAATAATAMADSRKKRLPIESQVADTIQQSSEAIQQLKIKTLNKERRRPPVILTNLPPK